MSIDTPNDTVASEAIARREPPKFRTRDWKEREADDRKNFRSRATPPELIEEKDFPSNPEFEWRVPKAIPNDLRPVLAFDTVEMLPPWFNVWVDDAAERAQCAPDYLAAAVITAFGSVVGRQIGIRPKARDSWTQIPTVWGMIVGEPGDMKTPAMTEALRPLYRLGDDADAQWDADEQIREFNKKVLDARRKKLDSDLDKVVSGRTVKDPDDRPVTLEQIQGEDARLTADVKAAKIAMTKRQFLKSDVTVEKLAVLLEENPTGFLYHRDELTGWLAMMDREGHENDRSFFLECWDGKGRYSQDRIGRAPINLKGACLSVLGGVQPRLLAAYLADGLSDDGLLQRFQMTVWPDTDPDYEFVDREPDDYAYSGVVEAFRRAVLLDTQALGATVPTDGVPFLRFDPDAQRAYTAWLTALMRRIRRGKDSAAVLSHLTKYPSLVPSLALLFHLMMDGKGPVPGPAVNMALLWAAYLEQHSRRIYQSVTDPVANATRTLGERIVEGDVPSPFRLRRDVFLKHWGGLKNADVIEGAAEALVDLQWLQKIETRPGSKGGATRTDYVINPWLKRKRVPK